MDIHRYRVWNTKRELYLHQCTVIDNLGQLYEVKSGLKPLNPDIHIIERCTGRLDKSGNLVYAGDIVKGYHWGIGRDIIAEVFFDEHDLSFSAHCLSEYRTPPRLRPSLTASFAKIDDIEIIGNIHKGIGDEQDV